MSLPLTAKKEDAINYSILSRRKKKYVILLFNQRRKKWTIKTLNLEKWKMDDFK